jgi:two-component system, OmpR family, copper resistance phosphate regulon response regulator CusR
LAENHQFDLIFLDIMLPERDGISILRHLRRSGKTVPVLFPAARSEVQDRAFGLDAGTDDYLVKPFSVVELLARVREPFRRQRPELNNRLKVKDLEMDLLARTVSRERHSITLTNREFSPVELLITASPKPVSKAMIIDRVWDRSCDSETNLVNVYVNHLRKENRPSGAGHAAAYGPGRRLCAASRGKMKFLWFQLLFWFGVTFVAVAVCRGSGPCAGTTVFRMSPWA